MAATLADVARRSGVSVATASRVLNNKMVMPIPPTTIERIRRAAEELEYRPNPMARALATGRTQTLGLFSKEMTDPHFAQMLEAVEAKASALGYHLIVSSSLEEVARRGRADGVVLLGSPHDDRFSALSQSLPRVFVYNGFAPHPNLVGWSDEQGMEQAVEHLARLGHRRVAVLFCYGEERYIPPTDTVGLESRFAYPRAALAQHPKVTGLRKAARSAGLEIVECWQAFLPDQIAEGCQFENGRRATQMLLEQGVSFTAMVARNDFLALGALRALQAAGRTVPQDISLVGYTDSLHALFADPPLTSVRTPIAQAGEIAVEQLIGAIENRNTPFEGILLPTTLTIRQSSGNLPGR